MSFCTVFALLLGCAGSANLQWWLSPGRLYNRVEVAQGEEGGAGSCKDVKCKVMMLVMRRWILKVVMKFKSRRDKVSVIVQDIVACSLKSSALVMYQSLASIRQMYCETPALSSAEHFYWSSPESSRSRATGRAVSVLLIRPSGAVTTCPDNR